MRSIAFGLVVLLVAGCDDTADKENKRAEQETIKEARQKYRSAQEAERKALTENPLTIEERLSRWLEAKNGLFVLRNEQSSVLDSSPPRGPWFAIPANTPWFVRCDDTGLNISLGPWTDGGSQDQGAEPTFGLLLSGSGLKDDDCKGLVEQVGRRMLELQRKQ